MNPSAGFSPAALWLAAFAAAEEAPSKAATAQASSRVPALDVLASYFEPSVFVPGFASFHLPGGHLRADTAAYSFEAVVIPRFTVFRFARTMLQIDPEFTVRRFDNLPSNPVRTPDYKPRATLYRVLKGDAPGFWAASFSGWHHSNGQEGAFGDVRTDGGRLNDVDGSFSLWGADAAIHWIGNLRFLPEYRSVRLEYLFQKEGALDGLYPDFILSAAAKTGWFRHVGWAGFSGRSRLSGDVKWRVPRDNDLHESLKPDPFSLSIAAAYAPDWRPKFLPFSVRTGDFSFFGRLYLGPDYYNIHFNKPVYRVDFGLMANPYGRAER